MRDGLTKGSLVRVICNPASGGGAYDPASLRAVLGGPGSDWDVTKALGEAARERRSGLLVVAGGDGTVNEVVNGLSMAWFPGDVTLALLPTGTSNDLAATLKVPPDPKRAAEAIRAGRTHTLGAARIRFREVGEVLFANFAVGARERRFPKRPATRRSRAGGASSHTCAFPGGGQIPRDVQSTACGRWNQVANLVLGNCRYAGGGWPTAPRANRRGRALDLMVIEDTGLSDMLARAPTALARANHQESEGVFFARGKNLRIEARPPGGLEFDADGEQIGRGPAEFAVIPRALKVVVGPGYTPKPERWLEEPRCAKSRLKTWGRSLLPILGRRPGQS